MQFTNPSQLALTWAGGEYAWVSAHVLASLIVGFIISSTFVLWQWKGTQVPLVPSKFFRRTRYAPTYTI